MSAEERRGGGQEDVEGHIDPSLPEGSIPARQERRHQVLALGGGGYRGLYSAAFLAHVETNFQCRVAAKFDVLAGTSIGGLVAAALAFEIPAGTIAGMIAEHGPKIFPKRRVVTKVKQTFFRAPYSSDAVTKAAIATMGEANAGMKLRDVKKPLAVCAVNYTRGLPAIFRSGGLAGNKADDVTVLQAVLASAAAPTYFPPQVIGGETLIDGGVIANAPELVGLSEGCGNFGWQMEDTYVLSLGTASRRMGAAVGKLGSPSTASWMVRRRLFQVTMEAQEELAVSQCTTLLRDRYYRVDKEPLAKQEKSVALDNATTEAKETLMGLAAQSWTEHQSNAGFRSFFS
jgi:predicted acylesterase/phospholipase RssA